MTALRDVTENAPLENTSVRRTQWSISTQVLAVVIVGRDLRREGRVVGPRAEACLE